MATRRKEAGVGQISLFGEPAVAPAPPSIRSLPARARTRRPSGTRRTSFVVGRLNRKTREMRLLSQPQAAQSGGFPGPWSLEAVVGGAQRPLRLV